MKKHLFNTIVPRTSLGPKINSRVPNYFMNLRHISVEHRKQFVFVVPITSHSQTK